MNFFDAATLFLTRLDGFPRISLDHVEKAASMRNDPAEDATPAEPSPTGPSCAKEPFATPGATLPNYRRAIARRRAALGSMYAASAILFALPWLTLMRPESPPQASSGEAVQVAQADAITSSLSTPFPATASVTGAEGGTSEPPEVSRTSPGLPERTRPEVQHAVAAGAAPPPHAEPLVRRGDPPQPGAPPGDRRAVMAFDAPVLFRGPIFNETMGQRGHVILVIRGQTPTGAITARFDASQGLSGTGSLTGTVSGTGQINASGRLLMGKNPFICDLSGTLNGRTLIGSASFVRSRNSRVYHSRFNLVRI